MTPYRTADMPKEPPRAALWVRAILALRRAVCRPWRPCLYRTPYPAPHRWVSARELRESILSTGEILTASDATIIEVTII